MFLPHPQSRWWLSGQLNLIDQAHQPFASPYDGHNSFRADRERALSRVWTLYTGVAVSRRFEILLDIESAGGRGLSDALGLAGFTNLDVVRNPTLGSTPYVARAMAHWTIALSDDEVDATPTAFALAARVPARRLEMRAGKFSVADFFDVNGVLSDSHLQFTNWTVDNNGAYDYAADTRGYTVGSTIEYTTRRWSVRGAEALMPTVANGLQLEWHLSRAHADNVELELRPSPRLIARLVAYANHANMGSYDEAIEGARVRSGSVPDVVATRRQGRTKTGVGLNVEYAVSQSVRIGARTGWNEGHHESFAYTEVNDTDQVGGDVSGSRWKRTRDKIGAAIVSNGLSAPHREYLARGGLGFLLGDGRLRYGREQVMETYYTAHIWRGVFASAGLERIDNPGYNRDRGPVLVRTFRAHMDF